MPSPHATVVLSLALFFVAGVTSSSLRPPPLSATKRLRGGEDSANKSNLDRLADDAEASEVTVPPPAALSKDEIMDKLNGVPVFCITNKDGGIIGMTDAEGGKRSVAWFTDATEAKAILKAMSEANPEAGLKLTCHGLGGAFTQCNGWSDGEGPKKATADDGEGDVELRLQGNHQLVKTVAPKLTSLLTENGFDPGCWQHPVFLCEQLASPSIMPVFLHPKDLAAVWERTGRDAKELPKDVTVLDIRMLVAQMQTDANPWAIFHLVASPEAIKLAGELTGEAPATGEEGNAAPGNGAMGAPADETSVGEDEDDEVVV